MKLHTYIINIKILNITENQNFIIIYIPIYILFYKYINK